MRFPRDEHPLGIERASHLTMHSRDLKEARKVYEQALGGIPIHEEETPRQKRSVLCGGRGYRDRSSATVVADQSGRPGYGAGGRGHLLGDVQDQGLEARASEHLRSKGQRVADDEGSMVIDGEDAFGMVLGFTERAIPNNPQ